MTSLRRIENHMGTGFDIDVRNADLSELAISQAIDDCYSCVRDLERKFSTYQRNSEISRFGRGEIALANCSADVQYVVDLCDKLFAVTDGAFDAYKAAVSEPARSNQSPTLVGGRPIETSGVVKGWAIQRCVDILRYAGCANFCVYGGGDMYVAGNEAPDQPWRIGLRHPQLRSGHMEALELRDAAIATSGLYERGPHIVGGDGTAPSELISMTVVGGDITIVDAYATAAFVMGEAGIKWVDDMAGFEVYAVTASGQVFYSPSLESQLLAAE